MPDDELHFPPRGKPAPRPTRAIPQARVLDHQGSWFGERVAVSPMTFGPRERRRLLVRVMYAIAPEMRDDVALIDQCHARFFKSLERSVSAATREFLEADEHPIFTDRTWRAPLPAEMTGRPGFWMRDVALPLDLVPPKFGTAGHHWDTDFEVLVVRVETDGWATPDPPMPDERRGRLIRRIRHVLDEQDGAPVLARIVHANKLLFEPGPQPALNVGVVFSFERDADRRLLLAAAKFVSKLKGQTPDDPELEPLARFITEADDDAVRYSRIAIPPKYTHGVPVYHGNLVVPRFCLAFRHLDASDFEAPLRCVAGRGPKGWLDMVPDDYWDRVKG